MWSSLKYGDGVAADTFEQYSRLLMTTNPSLSAKLCTSKNDQVERIIEFKECTKVEKVEAAKTYPEANVVFHSSDVQHPLYDFMFRDSKGHVVQVTLGRSHTASKAHRGA